MTSVTSPPTPAAKLIPVDLICPGSGQARRRFDPERLAELAQSIRESGVIQPVVVRRVGNDHYELLAGERRWRAAQQAGVHELPATVRDDLDDDEARVLGLVENLQRESLSPMETAEGLQQLAQRFDLTHEQVGRRIGKSRAYITNFLRLLSLEAPLRAWVDTEQLTLGHAKILCGLAGEQQRRLAGAAVHEGLSVRALERRVAAEATNGRPGAPRKNGGDGTLARLERTLGEHLGYAVHLQADAKGAGRLSVRFGNLDELDGLLARLGYGVDN